MTKKQKIVFLFFIIALAIIFINKPKVDESSETTEDKYYVSNYDGSTEEVLVNTEEQVVVTDYENSFVYTTIDATGDESSIMCMNIKQLTPEQSADKETLVENIISYAKNSKKSVDQINILDSSDEERIYVTTDYINDESEDLVILFDKYKTHGFTRCVNKEEYDMIQAGECAG